MKCRLCDRPTAAGTGKLCADCAKALQRARGATLSKLPPSAAAEATAATPFTLTVAEPPAPTRRSNRVVLLAGIGLSALALVYFAQQQFAAPRGADAPGTNRSPPPSLTERVSIEPSPVVTRVEEPSWTTVGDAAKTPSAADEPQAPAAASTKGSVTPASSKPGGKTAKAAGQEVKSMPLPLPAQDVAAPMPVEADAQQLAGARIAAPAAPVDGAQVLASAMQKCGSEGGLSKFICEQKTYYAYCEDKWDKDPKCMRKTAER